MRENKDNTGSAVSTAVGAPVAFMVRRSDDGHIFGVYSTNADAKVTAGWTDGEIVPLYLAAPTQVSAPQAAEAPRPSDDDLWDATLRDRDTYHDWADKLAEAVSVHFGVDIGEHSNMNCPWSEALDAINNAVASPYPRLAAVRDWVATAPHGENCHLTDDPEFDRCLCGKDNVLDIIDGASLEAPQASAAQEVRAVPDDEFEDWGSFIRSAGYIETRPGHFERPTSTSTAPAAMDEKGGAK